jgi:hypothetical protein
MGSNVCGQLTQTTQRALFIQAGLGTITLINFLMSFYLRHLKLTDKSIDFEKGGRPPSFSSD